MKTYIIVDKLAKELVDDFSYLFEPFSEKGTNDIEFLDWRREGEFLNEAVPDFRKKVGETPRYRVLILTNPKKDNLSEGDINCFYDNNPFDFLNMKKESLFAPDAEFPDLIKLTYMLLGLPRISPDMKPDPSKEIKATKSKEEREKGKEYAERNKKYAEEIDFVPPEELLIVSTLRKADEEMNIKELYASKNINDSFDFVTKNRYPEKIRFLYYEFSNMKNIFSKKDLFKFVLSVIAIATNDIPASFLQGYSLYEFKGVINEDEDLPILKRKLEERYSRLDTALNYSEKVKAELKLESKKIADDENPLESERVETESIRDFKPKTLKRLRSFKNFFILNKQKSRNKFMEKSGEILSEFEGDIRPLRKEIEINVKNGVLKKERILEDGEFFEISEYQTDEIENIMRQKEKEIFESGSLDSLDGEPEKEAIREKEKSILDFIKKALELKHIVILYVAAVFSFLLCFLYIFIKHGDQHNLFDDVSSVFILLLILFIPCAYILIRNYFAGKKIIDAYNEVFFGFQKKLKKFRTTLANRLGNILTYYNGKKKIDSVILMEEKYKETKRQINANIDSLKRRKTIVSDLAKSLGFEIYAKEDPVIYKTFEPDKPLEGESNKRIYYAEISGERRLELSNSGVKLKSPYAFLSSLTIEKVAVKEGQNAR